MELPDSQRRARELQRAIQEEHTASEFCAGAEAIAVQCQEFLNGTPHDKVTEYRLLSHRFQRDNERFTSLPQEKVNVSVADIMRTFFRRQSVAPREHYDKQRSLLVANIALIGSAARGAAARFGIIR